MALIKAGDFEMPRRNITQIGRPLRKYRVDLDPNAKFEKAADSGVEDRVRAKLLRSAKLPPELQAAANDLADRLDGRSVPETLASSRFMRSQRIDLIGALWPLYDRSRK